MNNRINNLNLARKWRSRNFDEIIGQEISVKILKNSIYLEKLFPVYLFAGQRGCGKTSTARVLGAAINCQNLKNFRENPTQYSIPCLECNSCKSMAAGNHPDFIEIDAASNTGVENVRQILESCSYMPILGTKKIYLIDEAHMLSKAAFNAFLKVLEEPPKTAMFILATTEIQKFPQTVLSRCFQVIFKSIDNNSLKSHLKEICSKENINIQDNSLDIIIQESQGSARDAINLLERIRFNEENITPKSILKVLGKVSEKELLDIFDFLIAQNSKNLLNYLISINFNTIDAQNLWDMLIQICRCLIWVKFETNNLPIYINNKEKLKELADKCSINRLNAILQLLWSQEDIFFKTHQKSIFLETVLLQICQQENLKNIKELINLCKSTNFALCNQESQTNYVEQATENNILNKIDIEQEVDQKIKNQEPDKVIELSHSHNNNNNNKPYNKTWQVFLDKISELNDPLLTTILNQAKLINFDEENKLINIALSSDSNFFKDKLEETKEQWSKIILENFDQKFTNLNFIQQINNNNKQEIKTDIKQEIKTDIKQENKQTNNITNKKFTNYINSNSNKFFEKKSNNYLKITNMQDWPKASLITKYFPGKIKKI
ncbi:DNA polymerase III subunit gamma/tau [Candidatus Babeliales bacterium]|nr:DNA polymerase III subunit gamma/tau [Candidatus Babeliales bacterium]